MILLLCEVLHRQGISNKIMTIFNEQSEKNHAPWVRASKSSVWNSNKVLMYLFFLSILFFIFFKSKVLIIGTSLSGP